MDAIVVHINDKTCIYLKESEKVTQFFYEQSDMYDKMLVKIYYFNKHYFLKRICFPILT